MQKKAKTKKHQIKYPHINPHSQFQFNSSNK